MKNYLFLSIFFLIISCASNNSVYWCGDHPCINQKEKEAYFKKTMIVEIKDLKKTYKDKSEMEKLLQQTQKDEKKRIKEEKVLAKQTKLDEKRRIKEEKELSKEIELEELSQIEDEKKILKKKITKNQKKIPKKNVELDAVVGNVKINLNKFSDLVEKITIQNSLRPYPDINDIPN